jgi:hypothetical protein
MNIFRYYGQLENHVTNILMNILALNNGKLIKPFLESLLGAQAANIDFQENKINLFSAVNPNPNKQYEFILGIAPFMRTNESSKLEEKLDSIPDAWIYGRNYTILVEMKVRGALDDGQLAAHKRKFTKSAEIIEVTWANVINVLSQLQLQTDSIEGYLVTQFLTEFSEMSDRQHSSGMPKEIIGGKSKWDETHFIISGSRTTGTYTVDLYRADGKIERLHDQMAGIQESRRFIANFVCENHEKLGIQDIDDETIITDRCVKPGRSKDAWNQWRLGSYLRVK